MFTPIDSINHCVKGLKPQKAARRVLNTAFSSPHGMSKTPLCFDKNFERALKIGVGFSLATSTAFCMFEFVQDCTLGSDVI